MDQIFHLIVTYVFPALAVNVVVDLLFKRFAGIRSRSNIIRLVVIAIPFAVEFGVGYMDGIDTKTIIRDASVIAVLATMFYETRAYPKIRTALLNKMGIGKEGQK